MGVVLVRDGGVVEVARTREYVAGDDHGVDQHRAAQHTLEQAEEGRVVRQRMQRFERVLPAQYLQMLGLGVAARRRGLGDGLIGRPAAAQPTRLGGDGQELAT